MHLPVREDSFSYLTLPFITLSKEQKDDKTMIMEDRGEG